MKTIIAWSEVRNLYFSAEETADWVAEPMDRNSKKLPFDDLFRGIVKADGKVKLKIAQGRRKNDFVGLRLKFIINEKVVEVFEKHKFSGWGVYPISLYDRGNRQIKSDQYFGFVVHGRIASQKPKRSSDTVQEWDGSDFFMLPVQNSLFVTKRVVEHLKEAGITGWECHPWRLCF